MSAKLSAMTSRPMALTFLTPPTLPEQRERPDSGHPSATFRKVDLSAGGNVRWHRGSESVKTKFMH